MVLCLLLETNNKALLPLTTSHCTKGEAGGAEAGVAGRSTVATTWEIAVPQVGPASQTLELRYALQQGPPGKRVLS